METRKPLNEYNVDSVLNTIVSCFTNEDDIATFLSRLSSVNWHELIEAKEHERSLMPCGLCHEYKDSRLYVYVVKDSQGKDYARACPQCLESVPHRDLYRCSYCDEPYSSLHLLDEYFTCFACRSVSSLIIEHNKRAQKLHLPATLTTRQWRYTMMYFDYKCAYGDHPYECLEHYVPLVLNGGTMANNCLPSCLRCNNRKGGKHPDSLEGVFAAENLARIRDYLTSLKLIQETLGHSTLAVTGRYTHVRPDDSSSLHLDL